MVTRDRLRTAHLLTDIGGPEHLDAFREACVAHGLVRLAPEARERRSSASRTFGMGTWGLVPCWSTGSLVPHGRVSWLSSR